MRNKCKIITKVDFEEIEYNPVVSIVKNNQLPLVAYAEDLPLSLTRDNIEDIHPQMYDDGHGNRFYFGFTCDAREALQPILGIVEGNNAFMQSLQIENDTLQFRNRSLRSDIYLLENMTLWQRFKFFITGNWRSPEKARHQ